MTLTPLTAIYPDSLQPIAPLAISGFHELHPRHTSIKGVGDLRAVAISQDGAQWWVGGTQGKLAKSDDNGITWKVRAPANETTLDFRALAILDTRTVCAMSAGPSKEKLSRIYRTENGGDTWDLGLCPEEPDIFFNSMQFWDEKNGIVLADPIEGQFVLFITANGGKSWDLLHPQKMPKALSGEVAFAASNSCLAVHGADHVWFCTGGGSSARVFYSSDRGMHWDAAEVKMPLATSSSGLFSIAFKNKLEGVGVGGDYSLSSVSSANIFLTYDGGKGWQAVNDGGKYAGHYLSSVAWATKGVFVVDRSSIEYNALALSHNFGIAVGPNQRLAIFKTH